MRQHHANSGSAIVKAFQRSDRRAAGITRWSRSPITGRYNWRAKEAAINFNQLAIEIVEASKNVWKLYDYIYKSQELNQLTESLEYGHTALRMHLLIKTNLIVQDFLTGRLEDLNHGRDSVKNENGQNAVAT